MIIYEAFLNNHIIYNFRKYSKRVRVKLYHLISLLSKFSRLEITLNKTHYVLWVQVESVVKNSGSKSIVALEFVAKLSSLSKASHKS